MLAQLRIIKLDMLVECRIQLVLNTFGDGRGNKGQGGIDQTLDYEHTVI